MSNLNMITPLTVQGIINKFCYTIGMLPTSYKLSLTYEEQLLAIGHYLETTVYPAINKNAQALAELQTLFAALQDYVNNYFDNLDITQEISDKLDQMAQDGTLDNIINQEIFGQINEDIAELKEKDISQDEEIELAKIKNPNLEYMFTIHTNSVNFQSITADNDYYYLYDYANTKIIKRSLASNSLINEYIIDFGHGNGLTIKDNILYSVDFETRAIHYYNMTINSGGILQPFEISSIVNQGLTKCIQITKYKDNKLLVSLGGDNVGTYTKITDLKFYTYDLVTTEIQEITISNSKNIKLTGQSVLQEMEYQDGILYFVNSQPTQIVTCLENENGFEIDDLYTYGTTDILGISYGEAEGITILPNNYNGQKTLLIFTQVDRWTATPNEKTLKFYCFNLFTHLPDTANFSWYEEGINKQYIQLNSNASNYYEDGKADTPFKDLLTAVEFLNNNNGFGNSINVYAGTYYINNCNNFRAYLIPYTDNVIINGTGMFYNSDITIGNPSHACAITFSHFDMKNSKCAIINASLTSTYTASSISIRENSQLDFIEGSTLSTNTAIIFTNSKMHSNLTSGQRLPSGGQVFQCTKGSLFFLYNTNVPTSNIYRDNNSTIILPGYVNNV